MTASVITALEHERDRLVRRTEAERRLAEATDFLELYVWQLLTADTELSDDEVLGYGPAGA